MNMRILWKLLTITFLAVLPGCPPKQQAGAVKEWAIIVYMYGSTDFDGDASKGARDSIFKMKEVGSTKDFDVIVQFDTGTEKTPTKRYVLTKLVGSNDINNIVNDIDSKILSVSLKIPLENIQHLSSSPTQAEIQEKINDLTNAQVMVGGEKKDLGSVLKKVLVTQSAEESFYKGLGLSIGRQTHAGDPTGEDIKAIRDRLAEKPGKLKAYLLECLLEQDKVGDVGETNVADPNYLRQFIQFGMDQYQARHRMVILWSHSDGFSVTGEHENNLTIGQLATVLQEIKVPSSPPPHQDNSKIKIDILGFSECTMGLIENFYRLKNSAEIGIATEGGTPTRLSWPFDRILKNLEQNYKMGGQELARMIVEEYSKSHKENVRLCSLNETNPVSAFLRCECDLSALYISQVTEVIEPLQKLTQLLIQRLTQLLVDPQPKDRWLIDARHKCQSYAFHWVDLSEFCQALKDNQTTKDPAQAKVIADLCDEIMASIHKMVILSASLGTCAPTNGLSTYFPEEACVSINPLYSSSLEIKEIQWVNFLDNYQNLKQKFDHCIIEKMDGCSN